MKSDRSTDRTPVWGCGVHPWHRGESGHLAPRRFSVTTMALREGWLPMGVKVGRHCAYLPDCTGMTIGRANYQPRHALI